MFTFFNKIRRTIIENVLYRLEALEGVFSAIMSGLDGILASIRQFAIATPASLIASCLDFLNAPSRSAVLANDPALIDINERRDRVARDAVIAVSPMRQAKPDHPAWSIKPRRLAPVVSKGACCKTRAERPRARRRAFINAQPTWPAASIIGAFNV